jgi:trimeric autotransporter adhesin
MRLILASSIALALGFHAQAQVIQSALTPAGTPIRNQASASFIGPNGEPGVTFSGVAETQVSTVRGMQIKPDANNTPSSSGNNFALGPDASNDRIVAPGGTVNFAYTLTNTGNAPDRYTLSALQFAGDGFDLSNLRIVIDNNENGLIDNGEPNFAGSLELNANAHASIIVTGIAPTTNNGARAKLDLTGSSLNDPIILENNNIARATINNDANLILNKEARLLTDGRIKYRVFGSNQGARAARSSLSGVIIDGTLYFGILISDALPTNTTLNLLETPVGTAGGASAARVIYQIGFGTWTATPTVTASSIGLFIPDQNPTTGSPVTDTLNISGGYEFTFHVRAKPNLRAGTAIANSALIQYRDGTNSERETVSNTTLTAAPTNIKAMIGPQSQPTGSASGTYTFTDPSNLQTWTISRSRNGDDQTDQQNIESSNGSNVISYQNTVQNTGNARDTFNIRFDPNDVSSILPAGSSVQVYTPDGISPISNGLILEPNESADVIVRVTLPGNGTQNSSTPNPINASVVIRVTSNSDPSKTDITRNTIGKLPQPDVLIGPFGAASAGEFPDPADKQSLSRGPAPVFRKRYATTATSATS